MLTRCALSKKKNNQLFSPGNLKSEKSAAHFPQLLAHPFLLVRLRYIIRPSEKTASKNNTNTNIDCISIKQNYSIAYKFWSLDCKYCRVTSPCVRMR